jgi:cold shock CspA family protein/ribosome-associated translation inhibitor RaiA
MQREPEIVFHNTDHNDTVAADILKRITRLERFFDRIIGCRVVVDVPHKRREQGNLFQVRIELAVPGRDIYVSRDPGDERAHEDVLVTVRDAFAIAERELKQHVDKLRGDVKVHADGPPSGTVVKLFDSAGYGFLVGAEGHEVYFHQDVVADGGFAALEVGTRVTYAEGTGDMGPQATMVTPEA